MGIARKWVFPIRLVIFVVIAVAFIKVAFFADPVVDDAAARALSSSPRFLSHSAQFRTL